MPKPFFQIWDTEITFGLSVVKAIASFEWSTSLSKCKCSPLNGELLYSNGCCYLNGQLLYIFKCKCNHLNGELLYSNGRSYLNGQLSILEWMLLFEWSTLTLKPSLVPRLIQIPLTFSLGTRSDQWSDYSLVPRPSHTCEKEGLGVLSDFSCHIGQGSSPNLRAQIRF